ncbi:MAG: hypothetical protein AB1486_14145 [Planctomycetota bacterium]
MRAVRVEVRPDAEVVSEQTATNTRIEGIAVAIDELGQEHTHESGSFLFLTADNELEAVDVREGRWSLELSFAAGQLAVAALALGGRKVQLPDKPLEIPENRFVEIRGRWEGRQILRVRDATTRHDLLNVTVVFLGNLCFEDHPGPYSPDNVVIAGQPSPIEIGNHFGLGPLVLFVGAPMYAWKRVSLSLVAQGNEYPVDLEPGAELAITVIEAEPEARESRSGVAKRSLYRNVLRLREASLVDAEADFSALLAQVDQASALPPTAVPEADARADCPTPATPAAIKALALARVGPSLEVYPAESGPTLITGMTPGLYDVCLDIGPSRDPIVLVSERVEVRPGARTFVTLTVPERPAVVPLAGTLFVSVAWGETKVELVFLGLGERMSLAEMQPALDQPGLYRWDAGEVVPRRHELTVWPFGLREIVDVPPPGKTDVCLVVREPCDVVVRIIDKETGAIVKPGLVSWACSGPLGTRIRSDRHGMWRFRAPVGSMGGRHLQHG